MFIELSRLVTGPSLQPRTGKLSCFRTSGRIEQLYRVSIYARILRSFLNFPSINNFYGELRIYEKFLTSFHSSNGGRSSRRRLFRGTCSIKSVLEMKMEERNVQGNRWRFTRSVIEPLKTGAISLRIDARTISRSINIREIRLYRPVYVMRSKSIQAVTVTLADLHPPSTSHQRWTGCVYCENTKTTHPVLWVRS